MKPALLLVDLQNDYLAAVGLQPVADALISRAAALLDTCRQRKIPVIHIWTTVDRDNDRRLPHWKKNNRWQCVAGTAGHKTPESLQPLNGEIIVHKTGFNAFANSELDATLKKINCDTIILAGLHLHACVRAAAIGGLERGLRRAGHGNEDVTFVAIRGNLGEVGWQLIAGNISPGRTSNGG